MRHGLRGLRNAPAFTVTTVLTLALGVGRVRPGAKPAPIEAEMRVELKQWLRSHWSEMSAGLLTHSAVGALGIMIAAQSATAQYPKYIYRAEHRRPIEATLRDLQQIATNNSFSEKRASLTNNAMTHLTQFEGRLHSSYFEKGKLDQGIGDVQHILDNNQLDGRAPQALNRDVWN